MKEGAVCLGMVTSGQAGKMLVCARIDFDCSMCNGIRNLLRRRGSSGLSDAGVELPLNGLGSHSLCHNDFQTRLCCQCPLFLPRGCVRSRHPITRPACLLRPLQRRRPQRLASLLTPACSRHLTLAALTVSWYHSCQSSLSAGLMHSVVQLIMCGQAPFCCKLDGHAHSNHVRNCNFGGTVSRHKGTFV